MIKTKDGKTVTVGYSDVYQEDGNPIYITQTDPIPHSDIWLTPEEAMDLATRLVQYAILAKSKED